MIRSDQRIRVTHQGTLPRPDDLRTLVRARGGGQEYDAEALARRVTDAVAGVVQRQIAIGIDSINDGEQSKTSFSDYVTTRLGGLEPTPEVYYSPITGRDRLDFPDYHQRMRLGGTRHVYQCVGPVTYTGAALVQTDIANLRAAIKGQSVEQAYLPAVAPGSIEHWLRNTYYPDEEAFLYAIADAMHAEYRAIVESGFVLQIDDPDLADGWQVDPGLDLAEYRKRATLRTEVLNHALRGLPEDRIVLHMCWGSGKGPHTNDLPLREFVDIVLRINAGAYSIEAANPRHEWEWEVWQDVKLPDGKVLIPGVMAHCTDHVEHPRLIAQRLVRYASVVGRENVIAGSDCGLGSRVGDPLICWAKLAAGVEGARLASQELWR
ncbi:MAG: cobalamin-independent methionine synthase II family protein [Chloroflexi bacterium]|nr:cobalamin-independent methionine synthase II family protein [Chloroflexota bacterium]